MKKTKAIQVVPNPGQKRLPPVIVGRESKAVERDVRTFFASVAKLFEIWINRYDNYNTKRSYRRDVLDLIEFLGIRWPENSHELLQVGVPDVERWRSFLSDDMDASPNTLNREISSVSRFYDFLRETAIQAKLPINIPNPASKHFIKRPKAEPVTETQALTTGLAGKLLRFPNGDSVLDYRDRAILSFYLYSGARIRTGCLFEVRDLHLDAENPTIRIREKGHGKSRRTIGVHIALAESIEEYMAIAEIDSGPLFRARASSRSKKLGKKPICLSAMYYILVGHLQRLPRAMQAVEFDDGTNGARCRYSPHSLRATTATWLLAKGVDIREVQDLLGHKNVETTIIYDKRVRRTRESASHKISF